MVSLADVVSSLMSSSASSGESFGICISMRLPTMFTGASRVPLELILFSRMVLAESIASGVMGRSSPVLLSLFGCTSRMTDVPPTISIPPLRLLASANVCCPLRMLPILPGLTMAKNEQMVMAATMMEPMLRLRLSFSVARYQKSRMSTVTPIMRTVVPDSLFVDASSVARVVIKFNSCRYVCVYAHL